MAGGAASDGLYLDLGASCANLDGVGPAIPMVLSVPENPPSSHVWLGARSGLHANIRRPLDCHVSDIVAL
jgi:hypothetical protein